MRPVEAGLSKAPVGDKLDRVGFGPDELIRVD